MWRSTLLACALLLAGCGGHGHAGAPSTTRSTPRPGFEVKITAPTHRPRANAKWRYTVRVSDESGMGLRARLTMQVIDPLGSAHPVQFRSTTRKVADWPFQGAYRDYAIWPAASRGYRLVLRAKVSTKGASRMAEYWVIPR